MRAGAAKTATALPGPRGGRGPVPVVHLDKPSAPEEVDAALLALVDDLALLVLLRHLAEQEKVHDRAA